MECLVIDDNPMARLALQNLLGQIDFIQIAGECESALHAINFLQKKAIDLLFLDVEMPEMTGLEMLESLSDPPLVILITSKPDYAVAAFNLDVVDYIVKPITLGRLLKAVQRAKKIQQSRQETDRYFFVKINGILTRLEIEQILFIQAMGDFVQIVMPEKVHTIYLTMKHLLERLPADKFFRTHRSYIIALDKMESLTDKLITIGKHTIPVSEKYRAELLRRLPSL